MMKKSFAEIVEQDKVRPIRQGEPDDVFICCASFEERCLGSLRKFDNYLSGRAYIFHYDDPNETRERHLQEMKGILSEVSEVGLLGAKEADPIGAIAKLGIELRKVIQNKRRMSVTLDISTFTKRHLLLLLRSLDDLGLWDTLRVLYTEPRDYIADLYLPMSTGVSQIETLPAFSSTQSLNKPLLLVIFLGYEGSRAMALFNDLDPTETLLIVPKPAYHESWEGRTEDMNGDLITLLGRDRIKFADSRDPRKVSSQLSGVLGPGGEYDMKNWNCCIAPLGTKPQALGLYLFYRENSEQFSIMYAQPLKHNESFYSTGVGRTWALMRP